MSEVKPLPKFKKPPVGEVSIGMRFQATKFSPEHFGLFYESVKGQFPTAVQLPFLPPDLPFIDSVADNNSLVQQFDFQTFFGGAQLVPIRMAFKSAAESTLIQLQGDRLYFNWCSEVGDYPHFQRVRSGFIDLYERFISFAETQGFGPIKPILSEVLYVNPLPTRSEPANISAPEEIFRIISSSMVDGWDYPLHDLAFNARFKLDKPGGGFAGWLTANMSSGFVQTNVPKLNLQMIARGAPLGEGLEGVLAFHDIGHDAIVRNFAAITSEKMHVLWERIYE